MQRALADDASGVDAVIDVMQKKLADSIKKEVFERDLCEFLVVLIRIFVVSFRLRSLLCRRCCQRQRIRRRCGTWSLKSFFCFMFDIANQVFFFQIFIIKINLLIFGFFGFFFSKDPHGVCHRQLLRYLLASHSRLPLALLLGYIHIGLMGVPHPSVATSQGNIHLNFRNIFIYIILYV